MLKALGYRKTHKHVYQRIKKRDTLYVYNLTCDLGVGLEIERSWVQFLEFRPPGNNLRQVVHTRASVTKQYNLL